MGCNCMSILGLIVSGLALLTLIVALVADTLIYWGPTSKIDVYWGFLQYKYYDDDTGITYLQTYAGMCDEDDSFFDACDLTGRGWGWIVLNGLGFLFGSASLLGYCGLYYNSCVTSPGLQGIFTRYGSAAAALCILIAILVWEIGNVVDEDKDVDDPEVGISIWCAAISLVLFVVAFALTFIGVSRNDSAGMSTKGEDRG